MVSTLTPVDQALRASQVQPISARRCSKRSSRKRVEPSTRPSSALTMANGTAVPARPSASVLVSQSRSASCEEAMSTGIHANISGSPAASIRPGSCSGASGSTRTSRPV